MRYSTKRFGCFVCDGTRWELTIEFSNGHKPFTVIGDNAYPYNFDRFQEFLGMETSEDDYENESEDE